MAGQPRKRAILATLQQLADQKIGTEDDYGPAPVDAFVVEWVKSGKTMAELAVELTDRLGFDVLRESLIRTLEKEHPGLKARLEEARAEGAHGLAEEALVLVDQDADTAADVARARNRAQVRQWTAGKWNRDAYGQTPATTNVQVNLPMLHLEAFRALKATASGPTSPQEARSLPEPTPSMLPTQIEAPEGVEAA